MKIQIEFVTQLPRTLRPGFQVQSSCRESAAHAHAHRALRQGRFLPCLTLCSLCFSGACGAVSPSPRARSVGCPKCTASGRNAIVLKVFQLNQCLPNACSQLRKCQANFLPSPILHPGLRDSLEEKDSSKSMFLQFYLLLPEPGVSSLSHQDHDLYKVMLGARVVKGNRRQLSTWQGPNSAGEIILFPRSLPIIQKIHKCHCR
ncbi:uncharacterized protein LOC125918689 isoform X2 [Panthera uncia]|nr:uncharacterized protein LOC125918689 isoform X2 [Panthera uncia]